MSDLQKKDGGQAFPHGDPTHGGDVGMTTRDYFAAHALPAAIHWYGLGDSRDKASAAALAYSVADAMLDERAKATP